MLSLLPTFARAVGSIPFVEENVENRLSHHFSRAAGEKPREKSEAENEKQTLDPLDPKTGGQSQLKQLEAKIKEQMQQLQSQV